MKDGFYNTETDFEKRVFKEGDDVLIEAPWTDSTRYDGPQCSAIETEFLNKIKKYDYNFVNMGSAFCQYLFDAYHVSGVDLEFLFYLVFSAHSYGVKVGAEDTVKMVRAELDHLYNLDGNDTMDKMDIPEENDEQGEDI